MEFLNWVLGLPTEAKYLGCIMLGFAGGWRAKS